jgi:CheY-like chemotaxis protein
MCPHRVLIVDDEEMVRNLVCSLLSKYGHSCETAKDGVEALEKLKKNSFDSAVIDIVVPLMDGITLTKELLKLNPKFPVMIMTGHAD